MKTCNTDALSFQDLIARAPAPVDCTPFGLERLSAQVSLIVWLTGCTLEQAFALNRAEGNGPRVLYSFRAEWAPHIPVETLKDLAVWSDLRDACFDAGVLGYWINPTTGCADYVLPVGLIKWTRLRAPDRFAVGGVDPRLKGELWEQAQARLVLKAFTGGRHA